MKRSDFVSILEERDWRERQAIDLQPARKRHTKPRKLQSRREAVRHALKKRATSKS